MHVLIDALSTTNLSGQHVLLEHLRGLVALGGEGLRFTMLYPAGCPGFPVELGPSVVWRACPARTRHWFWRHAWERAMLPRLARQAGADVVLLMSGASLPGLRIPHVSLAMNPWALIPGMACSPAERFKAALQRYAYRRAVVAADGLAFLSRFMHEAYTRNAGIAPRRAAVVYAAIGGDVWEAARTLAGEPRQAGRVVCVSAMARHKGIETLIDALSELRIRHGRRAQLALIGGWPDEGYASAIRAQVNRLGLGSQVEFLGHLQRADLLKACARAEVFVLLSRCESFGIPGVEAQALGTPVICSDAGAMPEVYGGGAVVVPVDSPRTAADALERVLGDAAGRMRLSAAARENAWRYREATLSAVFLTFLKHVANGGDRST